MGLELSAASQRMRNHRSKRYVEIKCEATIHGVNNMTLTLSITFGSRGELSRKSARKLHVGDRSTLHVSGSEGSPYRKTVGLLQQDPAAHAHILKWSRPRTSRELVCLQTKGKCSRLPTMEDRSLSGFADLHFSVCATAHPEGNVGP
jgi:hypothetical protein